MNRHLARCVLLLATAASMIGCAHTTRYVTAEHWHDDNSFLLAYTEATKTNFVIASSSSSTAHVLLCRATADNSATCRPQVAVDRLLNPGEKIPDPPPDTSAPTAAPAAPAEPAAEAEPQS